jgi:COMPASS component SWD3
VEGRCVKTYQGHTNSKFSIGGAFGTYGPFEYLSALVVSGSEDGAIWIWDVSSKKVIQTIENAHEGIVFGTDAHPSAKYIASGGADNKVRVWVLDEAAQESMEQSDLGDQGLEKMVE